MLPIRVTLLIAAAILFPIPGGIGQDSIRLNVEVTKKTVVQPTYKTATGDERGRIQALAVVVKNSGIRAVPAGEVVWTALVRKGSIGNYKYSGKAALPALLSFKSAELQFGAFEIDSRNNGVTIERDKLEYDIAIFHGGKETHRATSIANFAVMAAAAQSMTEEPEPAAPVAAAAAVPAAPVPPSPAQAVAPVPMTAGAEPVKPTAAPAEAPPVPQQGFDFFNLNGRKPPGTK